MKPLKRALLTGYNIGNSAQTTHKIFYECRNNRITCSGGNNDAGCLNTDGCGSH